MQIETLFTGPTFEESPSSSLPPILAPKSGTYCLDGFPYRAPSLNILFESHRIANEVIDNTKLSAAERHELISAAIMPIAEHTTRSVLYIDEELGAHCTALFMGVEDLCDLPESERQARLAQFQWDWRETRRMILEDSGVIKVNRLFRDINRPAISSPVIERIRELRREQEN